MRVEFETPDHAAVIERILDGFIQAGELLIRAGAAGRPSLDIVLQDDDVPRWQLPTETASRLTADCEDLVIAWASYLRATGRYPRAGARIKNEAPGQVHCLLKLGNGNIVDIYTEHLAAQKKRAATNPEYQMGGFFSSLKHAVSSVGHGIASAAKAVGGGVTTAAKAVGNAAETGYNAVGTAANAVGDAAHYVAHDLPKAIIHEGASGLTDLVGGVAGGIGDVIHGVAGGVSTVVNAAGDEVAGGLGDALHQVGKLGGAVEKSFSSDDDTTPQQPDLPMPPDPMYPEDGMQYDDGDDEEAQDPFADVDSDGGATGGWDDDEGDYQ